ncbi:hypothetical protein ABI59_18930 [Acidobacteria bacterium Mor1]|nr:hypothetical protein ABI59_18930 [Acidobacteria bacterium Mor1]
MKSWLFRCALVCLVAALASEAAAAEPSVNATLEAFRASAGEADPRRAELAAAVAAHPELDPHQSDHAAGLLEVAKYAHDNQRFRESQQRFSRLCGDDPSPAVEDVLSECLFLLAVSSFYLGDFEVAERAAGRASRVAEESSDAIAASKAINLIGAVLMRQGNYVEAIEAYDRAIEFANRSGDESWSARALNNTGLSYTYLRKFDRAIRFFERARDIQHRLGNRRDEAAAIANIGDAYTHKQEYDTAFGYHELALSIREEEGRRDEIALSLHSLGRLQLRVGRLEEAAKNLERCLAIREELGLEPEIAGVLTTLAEVYAEWDPERATAIAERGLERAETLGLRGRRVAALESVAHALTRQGRFQEAYARLCEARSLEQEVSGAQTQEALDDFEARIARDHAERDARTQELVRNVLLIAAAVLLLAGLFGWYLFISKRRALKVLTATHRRLEEAHGELAMQRGELASALGRIELLEGFLPICAHCKDIRDETGDWAPIEIYVSERADVSFTHGICPKCRQRHYPSIEH